MGMPRPEVRMVSRNWPRIKLLFVAAVKSHQGSLTHGGLVRLRDHLQLLIARTVACGILGCLATTTFTVDRCDAGEARIVKVIEPTKPSQPPIINDRGDVAFMVKEHEPEHADTGIWLRSADGTVRHWIRSNSPLTEVPEGVPVRLLSHSLRLNHRGQIAFRGFWKDAVRHHTAIWCVDQESKSQTVVKEGADAPDTDGIVFGQLNDPIEFTSRRYPIVFFHATLRSSVGPDGSPRNSVLGEDERRTIWSRRGNEDPKLVYDASSSDMHAVWACNCRGDLLFARGHSQSEGQLIELHLFEGPRLELIHPTDRFMIGQQAFSIHRVYRSSLNSNRDAAFVADIRAARKSAKALLLHVDGVVKPILYDGAPLPGITRQEIEVNSEPRLHENGNILFFTTARTRDIPAAILFVAKNEPPRVLVDTTQPAPGTAQPFFERPQTPQGVRGKTFDRDHTPTFRSVQFNDRDQVAFVGQLGGDATTQNNRGIWFIDARSNQSHLVVRTGEPLKLPTGETKTIADVQMSPGDEQGIGALNAHGVLTYALRLEDESIAYVVDDRFASVPGPDAMTDTRHEVDRTAVEHNCERWEQLADVHLGYLETKRGKSTQVRLEHLASELRGEYSATQRRLASLLSVKERHDLTPQEYVAAVKSLQIRLRELPAIWNALSNWDFYQIPSSRSSEEHEFLVKTVELLKDYDLYDALAERVKAKSDQLRQSQVPAIQAASVNGKTPVIQTSTQGFHAAVFQGSLGTLSRGLLPELPAAKEGQQDVADAKPIEGPLGEVRQPLSQFAKFALQADGRLAIDRKRWTEQTGSLVGLRAGRLAYKYLRDAGLSNKVLMPPDDERRPFPRIADLLQYPEVSPAMELFVRIQEITSDPQQSGFTSGAGGGDESIAFENLKLMGRMRIVADELFRFQLSEVVAPWRLIEFESRQRDQFRLVVVIEDNCFILSQSSDGAIRCVITKPESAVVKTSKNFAELYRKEPDFVENEVIDFLDNLGMKGPAKPKGPAFRAAVMRRLQSRLPGVRQSAEEAIKALSAADYERRQVAFMELSKNAELYRTILQDHLTNSKDVEWRVQLERLVAFAHEQTEEYDALIDALGTLESDSQLAVIRQDATDEERMLIDAQRRRVKSSP